MTLALGLMSGTSCDGISAAVADIRGRRVRVLAYRTYPYAPSFAALLRRAQQLNVPALAQLNMFLGELFARGALDALKRARVSPARVAVIGSHGHTVYHGPDDPVRCTLQIGAPAVIAHRTGIPVVADFRMRDVAAGGQGAPLIPFFDDFVFGGGRTRALQNLGGIANVTVVGRGQAPLAFDTGPGNCLIDLITHRITRGRQSYDHHGALAAKGRIDSTALQRLMSHPYFRKSPPKSTGLELFNEQFLRTCVGTRWTSRSIDTLATVTYFTAASIADSYRRFIKTRVSEVIVSGGGTHNRTLMRHLEQLLAPIPVHSIERYGIPTQAKEPVAFALLALRAIRGQSNHLPTTTGAARACLLGSLTPPHGTA